MESSTVFVGNIPYEATESQLIDLFSEAGKVVNFRLVTDKQSGKPRGFGFCEFSDPMTAQSALRNLNNREIHGRSLRLSHAEDDKPQAGRPLPSTSDRPLSTQGPSSSFQGPDLQQAQRISIDAIARIVDQLSTDEQLEIVSQVRSLIKSNSSGTRQFLSENPQLSQALLHILMNFDAITPAEIQKLKMPTPSQSSTSGAVPPPSHSMDPRMRGPPPPHAPDEREMLNRVMSLTPEQIRALPEEAQAQIRAVRSHLSGHGPPPPPQGMPPRRY